MINNLHKFFIGLKSKYYLKKKLSECFKLFDSNKLNDASLLLKDIFSLGLDFSNNIIFINTVINYFEKNINNSKKKKF